MNAAQLINLSLSEVVAATADFRLARKTYSRFYSLACQALVDECAGFGEIRHLFLRGSLARGDWRPGISDIDTALIFKGQTIDFSRLAQFWSRFHRVCRFFPMVESAIILTECGHQFWSKHGDLRAYERPSWRPLVSGSLAFSAYESPGIKFKLDLLFEIYGQYVNLCGELAYPSYSIRARRTRARKLEKIEKLAQGLGLEYGRLRPEILLARMHHICSSVLPDIPESLRRQPIGLFKKKRSVTGLSVQISEDAFAHAFTVLIDTLPEPGTGNLTAKLMDEWTPLARSKSRYVLVLTQNMEFVFRTFSPSNAISHYLEERSEESGALLKESLSRRLTLLPLLADAKNAHFFLPDYAASSLLRLVAASRWKQNVTQDDSLEDLLPGCFRGALGQLRNERYQTDRMGSLKPLFPLLQDLALEALESY